MPPEWQSVYSPDPDTFRALLPLPKALAGNSDRLQKARDIDFASNFTFIHVAAWELDFQLAQAVFLTGSGVRSTPSPYPPFEPPIDVRTRINGLPGG